MLYWQFPTKGDDLWYRRMAGRECDRRIIAILLEVACYRESGKVVIHCTQPLQRSWALR